MAARLSSDECAVTLTKIWRHRQQVAAGIRDQVLQGKLDNSAKHYRFNSQS